MSYGGATGRGGLALAALSIWLEAPLLGVGPGNSYIYMLQRSPIGTPHNQYLNILVEFGIVGLVAWLVFLVAAWRTGLRIYRDATHPVHRSFALGWLGMFAGMVAGGVTGDFMIHSIRNGGIELFSGYYLQWVLLGGLAAIPALERGRPRPRARPPPTLPRYWRRPAAAAALPAPSAREPPGAAEPRAGSLRHRLADGQRRRARVVRLSPGAGPPRPRRPRLPERRQHPPDRRARRSAARRTRRPESFSGRMIEVTLRPAALAGYASAFWTVRRELCARHRTRAADRAARNLVPGLPLCRPGGARDRRAADLARAQHQAHPRGEHAALSLRGLDLRVGGRPVARRHRQPGDGPGCRRASWCRSTTASTWRSSRPTTRAPAAVRAGAGLGRRHAGGRAVRPAAAPQRPRHAHRRRRRRFAPGCRAPASSSSAHSRTRPTRPTCAPASPPPD